MSRMGQPSFTFLGLPLPPALALGLPLDGTLASDDVATGTSDGIATKAEVPENGTLFSGSS